MPLYPSLFCHFCIGAESEEQNFTLQELLSWHQAEYCIMLLGKGFSAVI